MPYIKTILSVGVQGFVIDVECHVSNGLPNVIVVGLANKAVDEARERIRSALSACKLPLPRKRIIINLAPADIPKDSTAFDLAIALAILNTNTPFKQLANKSCAFIGELGLDGSVRSVRGIVGKILTGQRHGITTFFVPTANARQALLIPDVIIIAVTSLGHCLEILNAHTLETARAQTAALNTAQSPRTEDSDDERPTLGEVAGQYRAKRALCIAAAGNHNIFLNGPPGTGKSMLAKVLPGLLPPMTDAEILEVTHLHSLAANDYERLVTTRPFRAPHHSSSHISLTGGVKPGEITLAHRGVLFLDEMPEFSRISIEALRQPLEDKVITVARSRHVAHYPADFLLIATANPCPCGYYGSGQNCQCPPYFIQRYRSRLSGPIMDRFDLHVTSEAVEHDTLLGKPSTDTEHTAARMLIQQARERQTLRYGPGLTNAGLRNHAIRTDLISLDASARSLLNTAADRLRLSARGYMRTIKVARTIADLEGSDRILPVHMAEALQYRSPSPADNGF